LAVSSETLSIAAQHKLADGGDAEALYQYGLCLRDGDGVAKDLCGAASYLILSGDQGRTRVWVL
jgi:TPR repeat protein